MSARRFLIAIVLATTAYGNARAQDGEVALDQAGSPSDVAVSEAIDSDMPGAEAFDPAAAEPEFDVPDAPIAAWRPLFDARLRLDHVTGLPGGRADLERTRLGARFGAARDGGALAVGVAIRAALGSNHDRNDDNLRNNDNERSNAFDLNQAWLLWRTGERTRLQLGKAPLPLPLSALAWDADLRPIGVAWSHEHMASTLNRWQAQGGAFEIDHPLAKDGPRLATLQLGWHWREGAPTALSASAAYLVFDHLDPLAQAGLARGNPLRAGAYADDYRLLDLQFALRRQADARTQPLEARIELLRNLGAQREHDAARFDLTWGTVRQPRDWQLGYAYQTIDAAAVLAAVNSDDWWFHAGTRGHQLSLAYGVGTMWQLRLSGFSERRDDLDEDTRRLLLDLQARW
ncbi:MAG TPA: hypothetical protein VGD21_04225 [Lysobacter sp.]